MLHGGLMTTWSKQGQEGRSLTGLAVAAQAGPASKGRPFLRGNSIPHSAGGGLGAHYMGLSCASQLRLKHIYYGLVLS